MELRARELHLDDGISAGRTLPHVERIHNLDPAAPRFQLTSDALGIRAEQRRAWARVRAALQGVRLHDRRRGGRVAREALTRDGEAESKETANAGEQKAGDGGVFGGVIHLVGPHQINT